MNRIVGGSSGGEGCIQSAIGSTFGIGEIEFFFNIIIKN